MSTPSTREKQKGMALTIDDLPCWGCAGSTMTVIGCPVHNRHSEENYHESVDKLNKMVIDMAPDMLNLLKELLELTANETGLCKVINKRILEELS